jgi:PEP-CTERM motif
MLYPKLPAAGGSSEKAAAGMIEFIRIYLIKTEIDPIGSSFRFVVVSGVVPEPATWTMMLLGFAGLGYVDYRKVRQAAVARLTDTGAVKLFGAKSADRRQNFRIHRHYLAQSGSEAYNRRDEKSNRRKLRDRPTDATGVGASLFATRTGSRRLGRNFLFQSAITH